MRNRGSRVGWVRRVAIGLCALVALAAIATVVLDRREARPESGDRLLPSFSAGYECADARDQLTADELAYRLEYEPERWVAHVDVTLARADLRGPCSLQLGVPPGSRDVDAGERGVVSASDGSPDSGITTVPVRGRGGEYTMRVALPEDSDMFHSLGLGSYFFQFDFFAPGEGGSFKEGSVEVRVPDGYSIVDAVPPGRAGAAPERTRVWPLRADRDHRTVVAFQHDGLRAAVDFAPEVAFGAVVLILGLLSLPQRRDEAEAEPEGDADTAPVEVAIPAPAPVEAVVPAEPPPVRPEPAVQAAPPTEPEPEPEPAPEPEPQPVAAPAFPPPPPRPPGRTEPIRPPARSRNQAARAGGVGLGLLAAAVFLRLVRRRRR